MRTRVTAAPPSRSQRIAALMIRLRRTAGRIRSSGITGRDELVIATVRAERRAFLENPDDVWFNFTENALNDKRARARGVEVDNGQFILGEIFTVHHDDATLSLERADLTLIDGDQLTKQKDANNKAQNRAYRAWVWEWKEVIRPLLVLHPGWRYRDAYQHLLQNGGLPTPPDFGP